MRQWEPWLSLGSNGAVASAQDKAAPDFTVGKNGIIHLNIKARVGTQVLEPGMYQVHHAVEGAQHFIYFNEMKMPAGYRHSNTPVARDASARVACSVETLNEPAKQTTVSLKTNASGEKEITEVLVAGASFKHVL